MARFNRFWGFTLFECNAIHSVLHKKNLSQDDVAKLLRMSQSSVCRMLGGVLAVSKIDARNLYKALGEPSELAFLQSYAPCLREEDQDVWQLIYERAVASLNSFYSASSSETKGVIIGELEKLVEKYKPK